MNKRNNLEMTVKQEGMTRCKSVSNLKSSVSGLTTYSDSNSDSDNPFEDIRTCRNITFSRSRSYLDEDLQLMPVTPQVTGKENVKLQVDVPNSKFIRSREKKTKSRIGLSFKNKSSENVLYKSRSCTINISSETPHKQGYSPYATENLDIFNFSKNGPSKSPSTISKTPSKDSFLGDSNSIPMNSSVSYNTPFDSKVCQNTSTPVTDRSNTPQTSSFKRYSLMKAAVEAKKDYEDMLKAASLKKSVKKNKHKELLLNNSPITSVEDATGKKDESIHNDDNCTKSTNQLSGYNKSPANKNHALDTTPVTKFSKTTRCCQSLKTPSFIKRVSKSSDDVNKTPLINRVVNCTPFTGVKQLHKSTCKAISNNNSVENITVSVEEDDDLPSTQPVSSIILKGIVAYVEVRSGKECRSSGTKAELQSLGAKIENNFTRKVTHCFFHGGKMSTYRRAVEWKIPLVSTLWIEACKQELRMVPLEGYEPYGLDKYKEALPLFKLKTKVTKPTITRAVTDSKILSKPWKQNNSETDKAERLAETDNRQLPASNEADGLIDALHSVAGDFRKAADQFEQILTSPILQKGNKKLTTSDPKLLEKETSSENVAGRKKRNKKLVFPEPTKEKCNNESVQSKNGSCDFSLVLNCTDDTEQEVRVSYDSDDLLTYAKKEAGNPRCSAPARLLTGKKCKKLLSSCHKLIKPSEQKDGESSNNNLPKPVQNVLVPVRSPSPKSNIRRSTRNKNADSSKTIEIHGLEIQPKPKKRKLLVPSQVITTFEQDSGESTPDFTPLCPYKESPCKKQRTAATTKSKTVKVIPVVSSSDAESEDSLTRAARRESSALFIKKQKKVISQRNIPTIVCTSLHRSDVEVVTSIVSRLGKFSVEGSVSEHTTHVVTSGPRRTINLLKGIARGCWVLDVQWVYESLEAGKWLHEERFELIQFAPSVKQARVERQAFGPEFNLELFRGVGPLYVCRATVPPAADLMELLRLCGGTVVSSARTARIVVGSSSPLSPSGRRPPLVVSEKWILDSITKLTQLNPYDYIVSDSEP